MNKPRVALVLGILCISIFPVLIKLGYNSGLISAFYRMSIAFVILLPIVLLKKQWHWPGLQLALLAALCGVLFGCDVAVWNIAIQESTATQASLLTNLSPIWVGMGTFLFLRNNPSRNFWIGTGVALLGMVIIVGFHFFASLRFDRAFVFGILSGVFYAAYLMVSKRVLEQMNVASFMLTTLFASSVFLGFVNIMAGEAFYGFSLASWSILWIQAIVCQLIAWFALNYAIKHIRTTRVSLSLLAQAFTTAVLAWAFLGEAITLQMVFGGLVLLFGISMTFMEGPKFFSWRAVQVKPDVNGKKMHHSG